MHLNFEFKARTHELARLEALLLEKQPRFVGEDLQRDTYFNVPTGRMKLREGNIENALIHYERENLASSKTSTVLLYQHQPDKNLRDILVKALGTKVVVEKRRRIYFIDNVKFHFDKVEGLGEFVEVEAIDYEGHTGLDALSKQCNEYAELFGIKQQDYVAESYSDMMLQQKKNPDQQEAVFAST